MARTNKKLTPVLALAGAAACGCLCCLCFSSLLGTGGGKRGTNNTLNLFGTGLGNGGPSPKSSGVPATILSASSMSVTICCLLAACIFILRRQQRLSDAARNDLYAKLFNVLEKYNAVLAASGKPSGIPEVNAWVGQPFVDPPYYEVKKFVLLGKVMGNEYATLEQAKAACNANGGTHIQVHIPSGKAVVKTIMEFPPSFGNPENDTAMTLTKKCGEGYHPNFSTYVHPRLFLLNQIGSIVRNDSWVDLTPDDLKKNQEASEKQKAQYNEQCLLGNSGTCFVNKNLKWILLGVEVILTVASIFTFGLTALPAVLIKEGVFLTAEVGVTVGIPKALGAKEIKEANALTKRFDAIRNSISLSNMYVGGKESHMVLFARITHEECSKGDVGKWTIHNEPTALALFKDVLPKIARYEALPIDFWNCDETTQIFKSAGLFKVLPVEPDVKESPNNKKTCKQADDEFTGMLG